MEWEYLKRQKWLDDVLPVLKDLMELFHRLLLQAGGDVNQAFKWMRYLQEQGYVGADVDLKKFREALENEQIISVGGGKAGLTSRGERWIREKAFSLMFSRLKKGGRGNHRVPRAGEGRERLTETRQYRFGDPYTGIDIPASLQNAVKRCGIDDIDMKEEDLQVYETEHLSACATVLLIDISHSMILYGEDRITPAKQVALAFTEFILTRYPKDSLNIAVFGDHAKEIAIKDIPYITVGPYHTNTKAGLQLARSILRRKHQPNKQIFMITDGKPSAMYHRGMLYKNPYGFDPKIVSGTLEEAYVCRQVNILITTYMITEDPYLVSFVEKLSEANKGKAYYSTPDRVGDCIFVDYQKNKRMRNSF